MLSNRAVVSVGHRTDNRSVVRISQGLGNRIAYRQIRGTQVSGMKHNDPTSRPPRELGTSSWGRGIDVSHRRRTLLHCEQGRAPVTPGQTMLVEGTH